MRDFFPEKRTDWFLLLNFIKTCHGVPVLRIQDPVPFWPLEPGSGIGLPQIADLRSGIPNLRLIFWVAIFWVKNTGTIVVVLSELAKKNFFTCSKIIFFLILGYLCLQKKVGQQIFSPSTSVAVAGSGIRDAWKSGSEIQDKHQGSATLHGTVPYRTVHCKRIALFIGTYGDQVRKLLFPRFSILIESNEQVT